jgi:hypothetical protein
MQRPCYLPKEKKQKNINEWALLEGLWYTSFKRLISFWFAPFLPLLTLAWPTFLMLHKIKSQNRFGFVNHEFVNLEGLPCKGTPRSQRCLSFLHINTLNCFQTYLHVNLCKTCLHACMVRTVHVYILSWLISPHAQLFTYLLACKLM